MSEECAPRRQLPGLLIHSLHSLQAAVRCSCAIAVREGHGSVGFFAHGRSAFDDDETVRLAVASSTCVITLHVVRKVSEWAQRGLGRGGNGTLVFSVTSPKLLTSTSRVVGLAGADTRPCLGCGLLGCCGCFRGFGVGSHCFIPSFYDLAASLDRGVHTLRHHGHGLLGLLGLLLHLLVGLEETIGRNATGGKYTQDELPALMRCANWSPTKDALVIASSSFWRSLPRQQLRSLSAPAGARHR